MTDETEPAATPGKRGYVPFTGALGRAICERVASGETEAAICRGEGMPNRATVQRWAQTLPVFAAALARARAVGGRRAYNGRTLEYDAAVAQEIYERICEGETVKAICRDPEMPSFSTYYRWRKLVPEFAAAMREAREIQADRFCDLGWEIAEAVTPETAYATHVKLGQLRWTAGMLAPRRYGRTKPLEAEVPRQVQTILFRHFKIETHPQTGQRRVVAYTPDPATMTPKCDKEGEWTRLPDVADLSPEAVAQRQAEIAEANAPDPDDDMDDDAGRWEGGERVYD